MKTLLLWAGIIAFVLIGLSPPTTRRLCAWVRAKRRIILGAALAGVLCLTAMMLM